MLFLFRIIVAIGGVSMIEIVEVKTKKQLKQFALFPIKLYKDCPYYVPSFLSDDYNIYDGKKNLNKGTSDVKCFLALKNGEVVGRIAGIIVHESNKKFNEKNIRFNRFDFIDDIEVSSKLLEAVIKWGKENGLNKIHGPWGFNDTDREGMLTTGFDEYSTYATAYCYPYYHEQMEKLGYEKESEWLEHRVNLEKVDPRFFKIAEIIKKKGQFRDVAQTMPIKKIVKKYGDSFFDCYNRAYSQLDNYIPLEGDLKEATLKQFATIINVKYFSCIVDENDKVVSFVVNLPYIGDVLRKAKGRTLLAAIPLLWTIKHPKKLELTIFAVDPDYRNSGVHALALAHLIKRFGEEKITDFVMDPILTTNLRMLNTLQGLDIKVRATRQTYKKDI